MHWPALSRLAPLAAGGIVLCAGVLQFTRWKRRQLACCRAALECSCIEVSRAGTAFHYGLRLGLRCCCCCVGATAVLLAVGIMDLEAMALVTLAITAERLAANAARAARTVGAFAVCAGFLMISHTSAFST
jgi:predicted metal-binding membrane protein